MTEPPEGVPGDSDGGPGWAPVEPPPGPMPPPGYGPPPGTGTGPGSPPPGPTGGGPRTGPLPLHPMTVSDILDGAFKLMKANARTIFAIAAVFVVPVQLLAAYTLSDLLGGRGVTQVVNDPSVAQTAVESSQSAGNGAALLASLLLNLAVLPFLAGAVSQVVASSYLGEQLGAGPALRRTVRRAWSLLASWVVVHVLEVGGAMAGVVLAALVAGLGSGLDPVARVLLAAVGILAGIPLGLAVMALSVAVAPAVVVEDLGPIAGVRRSWRLMRPRFWPVLGIALLAGFVATVLGQVLGFIPSTVALLVGLDLGWVLLAVGGILTALVTTPIVAIVATLQYFDARIRTEGFDLEVIATELAAPVPSR
ncbi:MAG: DUF7544 domain-containing protein [Acidimicrobiales bacterium]